MTPLKTIRANKNSVRMQKNEYIYIYQHVYTLKMTIRKRKQEYNPI